MFYGSLELLYITDTSYSQQAIRYTGAVAKKPSGPDPDQPLPAEYVCYRCGLKGMAFPLFVLTTTY
jgi:hypothetical protein